MDGAVADTAPPRTMSLGTMFVSSIFDYLLIGGLLSWAAGAVLYFGGYNFPDDDPFLWWAILVSNWAHFAASTARSDVAMSGEAMCRSLMPTRSIIH